jgi:hypothetical protein
VAIGVSSLNINNTGTFNTAIGSNSLQTNTTGSNNTGLGFAANVSANNLNNATAIGSGAIVNASNKVRIGDNNVTAIDVAGQLRVNANGASNDFALPNGRGTAAQVLTTDGAGATFWVNGAASGGGAHTIGESYGGGIVFYVYDGGQHGLIAATEDQSDGIRWYNGTYRYTGTTGDGLGAGAMNTAMIVATQIADNLTGNFAAKVCADYSVTVGGVTYGDWYLPSKHELNLLYLQKNEVSGFVNNFYLSSTEVNLYSVWRQLFFSGGQANYDKGDFGYVRAVRAF